ncbi:MAG TPA: cache domain-containing protein [Vicinamibacteria bacterium]|nr:cache domain-containing protein [Vicinamibacteria bacterium]
MAKQRYYLDTRVLTAFFFAAMPFVAFGSFIVVNQARNHLRESVGISLEQRAVQTKLALEQYVGEQVVHLRVLALDPEVQKALGETRPLPPEAEARQTDQAWASGKDPKLNASLLDGPLARRLEPLTVARPAVKAVQLIDSTGRLRAATSRGGRVFFGELDWFKAFATQLGEGEVYVGESFRPTGTTLNLLEIAFPVRTSDDVWLGAVRMLVDAGDLYTVLAPVRVGRTGHASLLRSTDGLILASDESERILKMPLPGFESLRNAVEGFPMAQPAQEIFGRAGFHRGYWAMPEVKAATEVGRDVVVEPARLIGFSPIDQVPNVNWMVTVEQDLSEALAPINSVTRYLWFHFIGVFATVVLLALYFSFKLEKPVMEEGLHLHEEHVPSGMKASAGD